MQITYTINTKSTHTNFSNTEIHHHYHESSWRDFFLWSWLFSNTDHSPCSSSKDVESIGIFAAILLLLTIAFSGIVIGALGIRELINVIHKLTHGRQILRALYTFLGAAAGAYFGITIGLVVGLLLAASLPGLGITAGIIIGAILCAGIGLGIGTYFCKWTAMLVSWIFNGEANPDTWELTNNEKLTLARKNIDSDRVQNLFNSIGNQIQNGTELSCAIHTTSNTTNQTQPNYKAPIKITHIDIDEFPMHFVDNILLANSITINDTTTNCATYKIENSADIPQSPTTMQNAFFQYTDQRDQLITSSFSNTYT